MSGPQLEVFQLLLRPLGEQVIGDADGQLLFLVQLGDHLIILRIVLEATAGVDGAGEAQTVQLAHKLAGGINLLFQRQLRPFRQRGVQDHGVGLGDQHAGRVAVGVALDLATRRVRRVFGVADHLQRRAVEQRAIVEVQNEHRRVRRRLVDFVQRRHAALGELEFGQPPTTRTHCGFGVRSACSFNMRRASASEGTPSQRSSRL